MRRIVGWSRREDQGEGGVRHGGTDHGDRMGIQRSQRDTGRLPGFEGEDAEATSARAVSQPLTHRYGLSWRGVISLDLLVCNALPEQHFDCLSRLSSYLVHAGNITKMTFPASLEVINFGGCEGVTGDISNLNLPENIQKVELSYCISIRGKEMGLVGA